MNLARTIAAALLAAAVVVISACGDDDGGKPAALRVGVSAVKITPCGTSPDWDGPITPNGVWGEQFTDTNGNGLWDLGETIVQDPVSTELDPAGARSRYNGIFLAGFGSNRLATGCNDDLWARTIVIDDGKHKISMTSVDLVGYLRHGTYYGFQKAEDMVDPELGIDTFLYSTTHQHEGPDAMGLWGFREFEDGKFPRYLQFVDRMIARSIELAAAPENMREAAEVIAASTTPVESPDLLGLQVRTGCRPPWFFDDELRALRFADAAGETIATMVNWSTHPESLEDENTLVSSDFVHYIRERVETDLGGTAVYFAGALGAAEIVGDTCVTGADARHPDGSNEFDRRDDIGVPRTRDLGEIVGGVVVDMIADAPALPVASLQVDSVEYHALGTNPTFVLGARAGILDLDPVAFDSANCGGDTSGLCAPVVQHAVQFLDDDGEPLLQLVTSPGEIFPELFYGVAEHGRDDCPQANTGRPFEPSVRDAMSAPHRWLIGLSPDQFGYIVPGYDFRSDPSPGGEADDPCRGQNYDPSVPRRTVPRHYHESLSVGIDMAPLTICHTLRLLGRDDVVSGSEACQGVLGQP
jgi:hypothetical protein